MQSIHQCISLHPSTLPLPIPPFSLSLCHPSLLPSLILAPGARHSKLTTEHLWKPSSNNIYLASPPPLHNPPGDSIGSVVSISSSLSLSPFSTSFPADATCTGEGQGGRSYGSLSPLRTGDFGRRNSTDVPRNCSWPTTVRNLLREIPSVWETSKFLELKDKSEPLSDQTLKYKHHLHTEHFKQRD